MIMDLKPRFKQEINIDEWVLPNRIMFNRGWIEHHFKNYNSSLSSGFDLYNHQKFIKEYMQYKSPYRGILLYMGLGTGKTCASIAAAELLSPYMNIVIMTPASLKANYINEIKKCGALMYNKEQKWHKNIDNVFIPSNTGTDYNDLSSEDKNALDRQIDSIIDKNYTFVSYNGLRLNRTKPRKKEQYTYVSDFAISSEKTFFDDKCIIIDEVHNFISYMVNKTKIGIGMYDLLLKAKRCKIILLSGTPIVNNPIELAYIINIITGNLPLYSFKLKKGKNIINENELIKQNPYIDRISHYSNDDILKITLVPEGFIRVGYKVIRDPNNRFDYSKIGRELINTIGLDNIQKVITEESSYLLFPTDEEEFDRYFVDKENGRLINEDIISRRILGAISYYSNYSREIYPDVIKEDTKEFYMNTYHFQQYESYRNKERKMEKSDNEQSVYRFYTRAICNFIFPADIERPYPSSINNDEDYNNQLTKAIQKIANSPERYLDYNNIGAYSPKYKEILWNLNEHTSKKQKSLVYSQFKTVEGVGLFAAMLDVNGYFRATIDNNQFEEDQKVYMIYENGQDSLLKIFNEEIRGKHIDVILITAAGAEGISLTKVRHVHILEPYWNQVRIDQVIGRAVRANSHKGLEQSQRNVRIHTYMMKLSDEQISSSFSIKTRDKGLSTDEYIYMIAKRKFNIIKKITDLMIKSSVDCALNVVNDCYKFPRDLNNEDYAYDLDLNLDMVRIGTKKNEWTGKIIKFHDSDELYIYDPITENIYYYSYYINSGKLVKFLS